MLMISLSNAKRKKTDSFSFMSIRNETMKQNLNEKPINWQNLIRIIRKYWMVSQVTVET